MGNTDDLDWREVTQQHRDRLTHVLGVIGVIGGYAGAPAVYKYFKAIGAAAWWDPIAFWVLVPAWLMVVGVVSILAPRLFFRGLPDPKYPPENPGPN